MTSLPTLSDWRARSSAFEEIAAWERAAPVTLTGSEPAEELTANFVTANFFHLLGAPARPGRTFLDAEQTPGQVRVVVLSHGLWQSLFGARADSVGALIELEERAYRVIGVMPPDFKSRLVRPTSGCP